MGREQEESEWCGQGPEFPSLLMACYRWFCLHVELNDGSGWTVPGVALGLVQFRDVDTEWEPVSP